MDNEKRAVVHLGQESAVEMLPGLFRTTLASNAELMLCHFRMGKGAKVPLHKHLAVQNGYVIRGRLRFFHADGTSDLVGPGSAYVFDSMEEHGSEALEDAEFVESFSPMRPEYLPAKA